MCHVFLVLGLQSAEGIYPSKTPIVAVMRALAEVFSKYDGTEVFGVPKRGLRDEGPNVSTA